MGVAPCAASAALARLNGREPKKPRSADMGLGCADAIRGVSPSIGARPCASRPQRIATSGPPRATRARMAASVISSQPLPRCDPELPGVHGEHPVEQQDALVGPGRQVAGCAGAGSRGRRAARGRCWPGCAGSAGRRGPRRRTGPRRGRAWGRGPGRRSARGPRPGGGRMPAARSVLRAGIRDPPRARRAGSRPWRRCARPGRQCLRPVRGDELGQRPALRRRRG